ncbi:DNA-binding protein [Streptococcus agalactiae]|nr:DNA-binding protein [Streptococcus agalactiae]
MKNIEYIRKEKGVSLVDIADCLQLKSQTVREKINGDSDFKFGEALKVQQTFFPEFDIVYLFKERKELSVGLYTKIRRKDMHERTSIIK